MRTSASLCGLFWAIFAAVSAPYSGFLHGVFSALAATAFLLAFFPLRFHEVEQWTAIPASTTTPSSRPSASNSNAI